MTIRGQHRKHHLHFHKALVFAVLAAIFTTALTVAGLSGDQTGKIKFEPWKHKIEPGKIKFEFRLASNEKVEGWDIGLLPEPWNTLVWISSEVALNNRDVARAYPDPNYTSRYNPWVGMMLTEEGALKMARLTRSHIGEFLAAIFDDRVVAVFKIAKEYTNGRALIPGNFTEEEASSIAKGIMMKTSANKEIQDPSGTPIRAESNIRASMLIQRVDPIYPDEAKPGRLAGAVILQVTINEEGRVPDTKVLQGHPLFSEAAISAVKQWVYTPTTVNEKPVSAIATAAINFIMPGSYFVNMDKAGQLQNPRASMNKDALMEKLLQTEATISIAIPSETPFQVAEAVLKELVRKGVQNIQLLGPYALHQDQLFYITREAFTPAALDAVSPAVLALDANRLKALAVASGVQEIPSRLIYFIYVNEAGKVLGLNQVLGPPIAPVEEELLRTPVIAPGQRGANPVPVRMVVEIMMK
jgi:TonB family protein